MACGTIGTLQGSAVKFHLKKRLNKVEENFGESSDDCPTVWDKNCAVSFVSSV